MIVYILLKISGVNHQYLKPFSNPICYFNVLLMYILSFVMSSNLYWGGNLTTDANLKAVEWMAHNIFNIGLIIGGFFIGVIYSLNGLRCTAVLFFVMYLCQKYVHIFIYILDLSRLGDACSNCICFMFFFFLLLYLIVLFF